MTTSAQLAIKEFFVDHFPSEAAQVLQSMNPEELTDETLGLSQACFSTVMDLLPPAQAVALFERSSTESQAGFLRHAPPRLLLKVLLSIGRVQKEQWLAQLRDSDRQEIENLLDFPPNSVASVMESSVGSIPIEKNVDEALDQIRNQTSDQDSFAFLTDNENRLVGRVSMHDLAIARAATPLHQLAKKIDPEFMLHVSDPYEAVADLIEETEIDALPVVDEHSKLLGVVRHEQLRDVVESDAHSNLQLSVGVSRDEHALSPSRDSIRHRFPWLVINLMTAFLAAAVVGLFEGLIAKFTALAVLLPIVAGQSGNGGAQAMAVAIRGIALREISLRQWFKVMCKEFIVGSTNGFLIAILCAGAVWLWSGSMGLAIVIAIAMLIALAISGIAGALVPILLTRFGQDPATASAIILTTITDVVGFFVFLGTAFLLAGLL